MPPDLCRTLQLRLTFANDLQLLKRVIKDNVASHVMKALNCIVKLQLSPNIRTHQIFEKKTEFKFNSNYR
jgi:hypothetical protein